MSAATAQSRREIDKTTRKPLVLNRLGYPIRTGEPECQFFMQTAYCRFGNSCRYDHPAERAEIAIKKGRQPRATQGSASDDDNDDNDNIPLNNVGLPLNPGAEPCHAYEQSGGYCPIGKSCKFHHSELTATTRVLAETERRLSETLRLPKETDSAKGTKQTTPRKPIVKSIKTKESPERLQKPIEASDTGEDFSGVFTEDGDWKLVGTKHAKTKQTKRNQKADQAAAATDKAAAIHEEWDDDENVTYNSRGFPLREGAVECQYYINTLGLCRHGKLCRFHHPEWVCEYAKDKPVAPELKKKPMSSSKQAKTSDYNKDSKNQTSKEDSRATIREILQALGLPKDACFHFYAQGECRNPNCTYRHDIDLDSTGQITNETDNTNSNPNLSATSQDEKSNKPSTQIEVSAEPLKREPTVTASPAPSPSPVVTKPKGLENEVGHIVDKLKLDVGLKVKLVASLKQAGAKESVTEIAPAVLMQALMLLAVPTDHVRAVCKEVAEMRRAG